MIKAVRAGWLTLALCCMAPVLQAAEPIQVAVSTEVEVSPLHAWQKMQDFSVADKYVPGLTRTEIVTRQQNGVGASRRVYSSDTEYLEETIIAWDEGQGFTIRLHRGAEPMSPFNRSEFRYHMQPMDNGNTRVTLGILLLMPLGSVGEWLGNLLARPALEEELAQVAAGLKHYYESGQPATDQDRERLAGSVTVLPASGEQAMGPG